MENVAVAITDRDGAAIALRLTNRSGILTVPVPMEVPDLSASQSPNTDIIPFTTVDLYARLENFEEVFVENLLVFADTVTNQNMEMIPLSELPQSWNTAELFSTPTPNL